MWIGSTLALLAVVLTIAGNIYAKEWATRHREQITTLQATGLLLATAAIMLLVWPR